MSHPEPNPALADWLEQCRPHLNLAAQPDGETLFEGILQTAATGQTTVLVAVTGRLGRNAAVLKQPPETIQILVQGIKQAIWQRIEEEMDLPRAWPHLLTLEAIFQQAEAMAWQSYATTLQTAHQSELEHLTEAQRQTEQAMLQHAAELERSNRRLARLEKAKTDFISLAGHELRTPLAVLQGYISMLLEEPNRYQSPDQQEQLLRGLNNSTERLNSLINRLIDISALETQALHLKLEPQKIDGLVRQVIAQTKADLGERQLAFQTDIVADIPLILADTKRLHEVLYQVLNNAVRYTPDGGRISLRLYPAQDKQAKPPQQWLALEISDTGIGIAPEDRGHVFDKFFRVGDVERHSSGQVKFKGGGPGLGLSLAQGLVTLHGGQIWVESPGHDEVNFPGSTFHLRFPVFEPNPQTAATTIAKDKIS